MDDIEHLEFMKAAGELNQGYLILLTGNIYLIIRISEPFFIPDSLKASIAK
jgi:hypothetical protein